MRRSAHSIVPAAFLLAAIPAFCQTATPIQAGSNGLLPRPGVPAAATTPQALGAPAAPPSLLDQPAMPPTVDFAQGRLTIHASNSSLRTILDQLGAMTGTKVDGLTKDERMFGVYGPGNSQEVLASLLDGTGYNVVIAGRKADGAPREIALSLQTAVDMAPQPTGQTQAAEADDDDDSPVGPSFNGFPATPQQPTIPSQQPSEHPGQVRTPQQMLQELQKMREQAVQNQNQQ